MNETGLAQSMQPTMSSDLFSQAKCNKHWIRNCFKLFPSTPSFLNKNKITYVFEVSPIKAKPPLESPNKNSKVPRCIKCHAFPSHFCDFSANHWECGVCKTKNAIKPQTFLPQSEIYDIILSQNEKPLYLFIFHNQFFFINETSKTILGSLLDDWSHSVDADVSLIKIGPKITYYDLQKPRSFTYFDINYPPLIICNSKEAHFLPSFASMNSSDKSTITGSDFFNHLSALLKNLKHAHICLCAFSMDLQSPFELDASLKEVLASKRVSIHLFTSKNADCSSFAKYCDRVHLFELGSNDLVAPELYQFLKSDSLFGARVKVLTPNCFEVLQLSSRRNITGPETLLTMLDGQSSIFVDAKMTRPSNSQSLVFQIVVTGIRSDGKKILRVLGFEARSTSNVESFDGVLYGCYLARQCAVDSYYISYEESYREHRERCIQLVSAWSSDGYYKRSILPLFRDVPLFMYSIQISDMYKSSATAIEKVATVLNLMNSTVDIMRRILYPILLLPPLSFPHRLQRSSIGAFKFIVFIRDFDGIAVILDDLNHDEEIQEISDKYEVPITKCSNGEILTNFFIEEQNPTFARFTEKLEVEVNGKRF